MIIKDGGHGTTEKSIEFWEANRDRIGNIVSVEVTAEPLLVEQKKEKGIAYEVEYNFVAIGTDGIIYLSGCNCGYGGTGPNGTATILAELGLPLHTARKAMLYKKILFRLEDDKLFLDDKEYTITISQLRREASEYDELLYEIEFERGREVYDEMKLARQGDDGEY